MTTIILTIIAIIGVILAVKYFTGRNKRQSEKSSLEKIATTISKKAEIEVSKVAKAARSYETVKAELLHDIEVADRKVKSDYISYATSILSSIKRLEKVVLNLTAKSKEWEGKAKEYKAEFAKSKDNKFKDYAMKFLTESLRAKKTIADSEVRLVELADKDQTALMEFEFTRARIANKRVEIEGLVFSEGSSFKVEMANIGDLTEEFKSKLSDRNIGASVQERASESVDADAVVTVDTEELGKAWDKL